MAKYPFTPGPENVVELFQKIQSMGVTKNKINTAYLKSIGFKSSYDTYLPRVLKQLGFVGSDGLPTDKWKAYGVKKERGHVMASALKNAYADLFDIYPNAYKENDSVLFDFLKGNTGAADRETSLMLKTFKNLCALADFEATPAKVSVSEPTVTPSSGEEVTPKVKIASSLQLNIEIHIAADTPDDKIETIFKNMKKYLLPNE